MLNWLLILSVTLASTTILMFVTTYIAILPEAGNFFSVTRSSVLLLSNSFNIFYIIISPLIFRILNKYYLVLVRIGVVAIALGCIGRYLSETNYTSALIMSIIVAISHVPIITAPYGLLKLFPPEKRGYAASIPLFVPSLGINFCIFYGMDLIASSNEKAVLPQDYYGYINTLHLIIAIVGTVSMISTLVLLSKLSEDIKKIIKESEDEAALGESKEIIRNIRDQAKINKKFVLCVICWGVILGINWTYGGMFGVIFQNTKLSEKQIALIGLMANISSALFSNLGTWIVNNYQLTNLTVIFLLNIVGFLASLFIQASSGFKNEIVQNVVLLCIAIVILRAGFSSFVALALMELQRYGLASVVVSCIFFWIANASNLAMIYVTDWTSNQFSLAALSLVVWICMFVVHFTEDDQQPEIGSAQKSFEEEDHPQTEVHLSSEQNQLTMNKDQPIKEHEDDD